MNHEQTLQIIIVCVALLAQGAGLTVFFYKEFATKADVAKIEAHLREMAAKDYASLRNLIDDLHADVKDIKNALTRFLEKD